MPLLLIPLIQTGMYLSCNYNRGIKKRGPKGKRTRVRNHDDDSDTSSAIETPALSRAGLDNLDTLAERILPLFPPFPAKDNLHYNVEGSGDGDQGSSGADENLQILNIPLSMSSTAVEEPPKCRYPCLEQVLPLLDNVISAEDACDLLDGYFAKPQPSSVGSHCPFVLSPVIREEALLRRQNYRVTSSALLITIIWCISHTADLEVLQPSSSRDTVKRELYSIIMALIRAREQDNRQFKYDILLKSGCADLDTGLGQADANPERCIDDILCFILLSSATSSGGFKPESLKWFSKAVELVRRIGCHSEERILQLTVRDRCSPPAREKQEELRRAFWLAYCMDKHLALACNNPIQIRDSDCQVPYPLPEHVWENFGINPEEDLPPRVYGPPTQITGTGFFEYFLPLMTILGDIIDFHIRSQNPRLQGVDYTSHVQTIEREITDCEESLILLHIDSGRPTCDITSDLEDALGTQIPSDLIATALDTCGSSGVTIAYSRYILHVFRVLLHAGWDPISIPDGEAGLITSSSLIRATQLIPDILKFDKHLSLNQFLFGVYLFHGSLAFLPFAERMFQVGLGACVEEACEVVIRGHEICLATLDMEYQVRHWT